MGNTVLLDLDHSLHSGKPSSTLPLKLPSILFSWRDQLTLSKVSSKRPCMVTQPSQAPLPLVSQTTTPMQTKQVSKSPLTAMQSRILCHSSDSAPSTSIASKLRPQPILNRCPPVTQLCSKPILKVWACLQRYSSNWSLFCRTFWATRLTVPTL